MTEIDIVIIVFSVIIIGVMLYGHMNSCPACKKWYSKRFDDQVEIDRSTGYETVIRTDVTRDTSGKEISRTDRQEQVHMTYYTYMNHYSCRACSHKWTKTSEEKVES